MRLFLGLSMYKSKLFSILMLLLNGEKNILKFGTFVSKPPPPEYPRVGLFENLGLPVSAFNVNILFDNDKLILSVNKRLFIKASPFTYILEFNETSLLIKSLEFIDTSPFIFNLLLNDTSSFTYNLLLKNTLSITYNLEFINTSLFNRVVPNTPNFLFKETSLATNNR